MYQTSNTRQVKFEYFLPKKYNPDSAFNELRLNKLVIYALDESFLSFHSYHIVFRFLVCDHYR